MNGNSLMAFARIVVVLALDQTSTYAYCIKYCFYHKMGLGRDKLLILW